jgi:hypothetical protein
MLPVQSDVGRLVYNATAVTMMGTNVWLTTDAMFRSNAGKPSR